MTVPVFVDVDGVINAMPDKADDLDHWPSDSWRRDFIYMPAFAEALLITWSTAAIDGLRLLEQTPGVEMVWCTTWKHRAPELLAPIIGLGAQWEYKDELITNAPRWFDWWKATRVYEAVQERGRAVWIDDDIDAWTRMLRMGGRLDELDWLDDRVLTVCPDTSTGLTAHELTTIEEFLR